MSPDLILPTCIIFSLATWTLVARWYAWPALVRLPVTHGLIALLLFHCFRYVGLMFLLPGVTSQPLDPRFAGPAAYGDLLAAVLAFIAIGALRNQLPSAFSLTWVANVWGLLDLLCAVALGLRYTQDGHLGATFWIPAVIVPFLLVTHVLIFALLIGNHSERSTVSPDLST